MGNFQFWYNYSHVPTFTLRRFSGGKGLLNAETLAGDQ